MTKEAGTNLYHLHHHRSGVVGSGLARNDHSGHAVRGDVELRRSNGAPSQMAMDSDFMLLTSLLNERVDHRPSGAARPVIVVFARDASDWATPDLRAIDVDWVIVTSSVEALEHAVSLQERCAAVLTDAVGRESSVKCEFIEALRAYEYRGPVLVVASVNMPMRDRVQFKRSGSTGAVVFRSPRMMHMLMAIAAGVVPLMMASNKPGGSVQLSYPAWVNMVIRNLAKFMGPSAGEVVRHLYVGMHAKRRTPPTAEELIEEAACVLHEWPEDKVRFSVNCMQAVNAAELSALGNRSKSKGRAQ
jgi:hypothetical protein